LAAVPASAVEPRIPVVEVLSADKVYANGTRALNPVELAIWPGEFVTLLGPSGCGKSTLLKMIANLIAPSAGRLLWWRHGFDRVGEAGKQLVMVFQDATLMPWSRVRRTCGASGLAQSQKKFIQRKSRRALALVGLTGFERHYPRQLSGGMQMRASIARALVTDPNCCSWTSLSARSTRSRATGSTPT
jgi:NitT/TauT family transport system ATP-binding protein